MDPNIVLFTNETFYLAFSHRDFESMERLWAQRAPTICVHPGWQALTDRPTILESWRRIFENTDIAAITPHHARVFIYGDLATVICYEAIDQEMLIATNIFIREDDAIRMVHHHASHCANPPAPSDQRRTAVQ